ncbi:hypothetical protein ACP70R_041191 [Stipagrostis hirtigluma subsp. patula]
MANVDEGAAIRLDPWESSVLIVRLTLSGLSMVSLFALLLLVLSNAHDTEATAFSVEPAAAGFQGLNATAVGHTVSPAFALKVRAENRRVLLPWCYHGGEVVVSYSGVALAWGHVPPFCVRRKAPAEFTVVPWGRGVGLPEGLRRRLAADWRMGRTQMLVEMKVFFDDQGWASSEKYPQPSLHLFQLMLKTGEHTG